MDIKEEIRSRKKAGLYRERQTLVSVSGAEVRIDSDTFVNFSSNDYLGLANDLELKNQMIKAINEHGIGAGSSALLTGYTVLHRQLEQTLASFFKREAALIFSSGYQANLATASALFDAATIIIQDKQNHASLIDAALLSKGKLVRYAHNNIDHLMFLLEKYKRYRLVVVTEGVFSMGGDYGMLETISNLCKAYNALLIVDDAHGIGVIGENGGGVLEEFGLEQDDVPLLIGTFGKAFGASGAFITGPSDLIECFIQKARTYIYTTALLPAIASTMVLAIEKIKGGARLRLKIKNLIGRYLSLLSQNRIESYSHSHIQPFIIGESKNALRISDRLYKRKLLVNAIRPPTVPKDTARLRISITAQHTTEQIEELVYALVESL